MRIEAMTTVNMLKHLNFPDIPAQTPKAIERSVRKQNMLPNSILIPETPA
jgi:hypothetical protein